MSESPRRSSLPSHEHVQSIIKTSRSINAQKSTQISPSAMLEVLTALDKYWDAVEASDLGEDAKGIYMSMAEYFVRWMRNDFVPGSRNSPYRQHAKIRDLPPHC
jgi:hypothetical protein